MEAVTRPISATVRLNRVAMKVTCAAFVLVALFSVGVVAARDPGRRSEDAKMFAALSNRGTSTRHRLVAMDEPTVIASSASAAGYVAGDEVASDDSCVSVFPDLCKFVTPLFIPATIDGSTGEPITLGFYKVYEKIHRDLPATVLYGYGETEATASTPGPTVIATRGTPTYIQWENYLTDESYVRSVYTPVSVLPVNGGIPVVMHLHGGETEPESDGHPEAWFTAKGEKGSTFVKSLYKYHNAQLPATLWLHDHTMGLTQLSTYFGLAGFYFVTDPAGDEARFKLPNGGYALPQGEFDIPLNILNKVLLEDGSLHVIEDEDSVVTSFREVTTTNNVAWPYLDVQRTKYRFRILNSDGLRRLNLTFLYVNQSVPSAGTGLNFSLPNGERLMAYQIATDAGYIEHPVALSSIGIAPAERIEVVVDFDVEGSVGPADVYIVNFGQLELNEYGLPVDTNLGVVMKLRVAEAPIPSEDLPETLAELPVMDPANADIVRWLPLIETPLFMDRVHLLGGRHWAEAATEIVTRESSEVWYLINETPQIHTIHLHAVKFRVISRQQYDIGMYQNGTCSFTDSSKPSCYTGEKRGPHIAELGWKDTFAAEVNDVAQIMFKLTSQNGQPFPFDPSAEPGYVWHCHIAEHEDFEMMRPFLIVPPVAPKPVDE